LAADRATAQVTRSLDRLLVLAAEALSASKVEFAVIGGCARNAYAPPRATRDVDVSVAADVVGWGRVVEALGRAGFARPRTVAAEPSDPVPDVALFRDAAGGRIDVLIAKTDFERQALARRVVRLRIENRTLPVVTPEDLVVFKLIAGRPRDLADAEEVARTLIEAGRRFDWRYVRRWCSRWKILERLELLRGSLRARPR
jgi:hypothetical protein